MTRSHPVGILRRLHEDRRGVSAVEFALIAPVMILFYMGLAEFCQGYMAQKRMGNAASMVADIVSQSSTVTTEELTDIFTVGDLTMKPFPSTKLRQRISSVTRASDGSYNVDWSFGEGGDMSARSGPINTIPDGLIEKGESLVVSEALYSYESPVKYLIKEDLPPFSATYYLRPRQVEKIDCSDCSN